VLIIRGNVGDKTVCEYRGVTLVKQGLHLMMYSKECVGPFDSIKDFFKGEKKVSIVCRGRGVKDGKELLYFVIYKPSLNTYVRFDVDRKTKKIIFMGTYVGERPKTPEWVTERLYNPVEVELDP